MAERIRTFVDSQWIGYLRMNDIAKVKDKCYTAAVLKQYTEKADHMIFGCYELDDSGEVVTARLYTGVPKTEKEFATIATLKHKHIYAIHKMAEI